jgi:hypothetical protein
MTTPQLTIELMWTAALIAAVIDAHFSLILLAASLVQREAADA